MKWFRNTLAKNRAFVLAILTVSLYGMVGGPDFAYAHQLHQQKEERLQEIADTLGIPVEKMRPDHLTLAETLGKAFGVEPADPVKKAGLERLQKVLREHEEQLAANPYLPQIEAVKNEHAIHRIEGTLQDILQLTDPAGRKALRPQAKQAVVRNLNAAFDEGLELPPLPEGLPAKAQQRHEEMQRDLDRIVAFVRPIVKEAMDEAALDKSSQLNPERIVRMKQSVEGLLARTKREPRFADRPLPLRRVEKKARVRPLRDGDRAPQASAATSAARVDAKTAATVPSKAGIAPEILALATELDNSPAKIFRFVHDNIDLDPKWGAYKGSLGTYWERSGTAWEQAWLLRDLLVAAGVDARFEWGEVEIDTDTLMNLTGVQDPWRAGDLMTTAGVPIVLLTQGSQVIKAQMQHVWVKAFVDYIPNRGLTAGPGDSWIRMDPSIKKFDYAPGIPVYEEVPFSLGDYLLSGTELSPRRAYEEGLWSYIRANNIDCVTLEQLKPRASIAAAEFPYLPGTLRAKILATTAESSDMPAAFQEQVRIEVRQPSGASLLSWDVSQPDTFGQSLAIDWRGATPDDQAILDSYGGVFEAPPYLVDLVPAVRLGGVDQTQGSAIGSAEDIEVVVTTTPPGGVTDVFVHQGFAGEPSVLVTSFGEVPQQLTDTFQAQLNAATQSGDAAAIERATLQMLGTAYFQNLGRDAQDIADWNWHRLLRLVSEGLVVQTGNVTTSAGGSPLTFERAERYVDFPGFVVGLFHAQGTAGFVRPTLELAGAQGSFLEGQVFDQVVASEGIAAVSALTLAQREGQAITRVGASNVDAVLASVELGSEIESRVRSAIDQGKIAWVPDSAISLNRWSGAGYVLADPDSGAAAYLISGGFAGGVDTEKALETINKILGDEEWLASLPPSLLRLFEFMSLFFRNDNPDPGAPGTQHGDPVNLSSGNFWINEVDLALSSVGIPIGWSRTYNSQSLYSGPLGSGWTFSFGQLLSEDADGTVTLQEPDGSLHVFAVNADGSFQSPSGKRLTLTRTASGFEMVDLSQTVFAFGSEGRLESLTNSRGQQVLCSYDVNGYLASVVDASGRTVLSITMAGDKIERVTDLAGRFVSYQYQGDDLVSVRDAEGEIWQFSYDANHRMVGRLDPEGGDDAYSYDSLGRLARHVDPIGNTERFSYSSGARSAVVTDRRGYDSLREFDPEGQAVRAVDPLGNRREASWNEHRRRASISGPGDVSRSQEFDENGNLVKSIDALGNEITYDYDAASGKVSRIVDSTGVETVYDYTPQGELSERTEIHDGVTRTATYTYGPEGELTTITGPDGGVVEMTWDPVKGSLATVSDPQTNLTTYRTDDFGFVMSVTDPAGGVVSFDRDQKGRVTAWEDSDGGGQSFTFSATGLPTSVQSSVGTMTIEYDLSGLPKSATAPNGAVWSFEHDQVGRLIGRTDPFGNETRFVFDPVGRQIATIDPSGNAWIEGGKGDFGLPCESCEGRVDVLQDPLGNLLIKEFDAFGRLSNLVDQAGSEIQFEYNQLGQLTRMVDREGNPTSYEYDAKGQLTAVVDALQGRTEYELNDNGQLLGHVDAEGRSWTLERDALGRVELEEDPLGNQWRFTYDWLGNVTSQTDPDGRRLDFEYEGKRLKRVLHDDGSEEVFAYDSLGRKISETTADSHRTLAYDEYGRLSSVTDELLALTIQYEYDSLNRRTLASGPGGERRYFYDVAGRLAELQDSATGRYRFEYDAMGRPTALFYPNGVEMSRIYDERGRAISVIAKSPSGAVIDGYAYEYDENGRQVSRRSLFGGRVETFEYDPIGRLSSFSDSSGDFRTYEYDAVGNRVRLERPEGEVTYSYDLANRLQSEVHSLGTGSRSVSYTWDDAGNLTEKLDGIESTTYSYDSRSRLRELQNSSGRYTFAYDASGLRVAKTTPMSEERFLLDGEEIWSVHDASGQVTETYAQGLEIDHHLGRWEPSGTTYFHGDSQNSITSLTDSAGSIVGRQSYEPFGGVRDGGLPVRYGFTGRENDETGLMYYRSRYLDPLSGRMTRRDSFAGFAEVPASQNRYVYSLNDPVNLTDPSGQMPNDLDPNGFLPIFSAQAALSIIIATVAAGICAFNGTLADCVPIIAWVALGLDNALGEFPYPLSVGLGLLGFSLAALTVFFEFKAGTFSKEATQYIIFLMALGTFAALLLEHFFTSYNKSIGPEDLLKPITQGEINLVLISFILTYGLIARKLTEGLEQDRFSWNGNPPQ